MSDRAAVVAGLAEYANKPATSREVRAEASEVFSARPFVNLMRFVQSLASRDELNALIAEIAPLIRTEDRFRAGAIAINCGSLVEAGGDPALVFPHLLDSLPGHLAFARRGIDRKSATPDALFEANPDAARALGGLSYLLLCTMTVICRRMEFRQALRANPEIVASIEALRVHNHEADFVAQVASYTDGIEVLVLVPDEQKGFRFALEAINNNFHLFTLIQAAIISGGHLAGEPLDPEMLGIATGEAPPQHVHLDHARWHFYSWEGLQPNGTFAATDFRTWIAGDAKPTDIPELEGTRIVVIGPMFLGARTWNSNEFASIHDALRSRAEIVEVLPQEEVAAWVEKIRQAQAESGLR